MGSLKALFLAGVASLVAMSSATAADLFLPPPPPVEPAYVPVEFSGGFYLRGDLGVGTPQLRGANSTFDNAQIYGPTGIPGGFGYNGSSMEEQAIIGIGAGYQVNNYFRADVTGEYRTDAKLHALESYTAFCGTVGGSCYDSYAGKVHNAVFLVNGYVDLGTWYHVTPYIGAGIGTSLNTFGSLVDTSLSTTGTGSASEKTKADLAYALMAGFSIGLTQNIKLDFGYRYLDMGKLTSNPINCNGPGCGFEVQHYKLSAHDVRLGLRYMFADYAPLPPPPPLVRKY